MSTTMVMGASVGAKLLIAWGTPSPRTRKIFVVMRARGCGTRVELRPRYGNERAGPPYPHVSMKHARRKTLAGRFRGRPRPFRGGGWIGEWEPFAGNCHGLGGPHVGIESSRRYTGNSPVGAGRRIGSR